MNEKPITTLGPWSYHNPIDMAADEQSFSVNKEVRWMNDTDKKIEKIKTDCIGKVLNCRYEDDKVLIHIEKTIQDVRRLYEDQLKKCRGKRLPTFCPHCDKPLGNLMLSAIETTEQRTRRACFKAGWAWIQDDFGEQFGYDPTDDTDKEDFKQVIEKAKVE